MLPVINQNLWLDSAGSKSSMTGQMEPWDGPLVQIAEPFDLWLFSFLFPLSPTRMVSCPASLGRSQRPCDVQHRVCLVYFEVAQNLRFDPQKSLKLKG
jgi:hypothetical protein